VAATVTNGTADPAPFTGLEGPRPGPVRRYFQRRPGVMDAVVMLVFAVPATAVVLFPYDHEPAPAALGFVAMGTAALAWRRHRPVAVAAAMGVLAALCVAATGRLSGFELGIGLAVYAVAVARPARVTWGTGTVLVATTTLAVWLWEQPVTDPSAGSAGDAAAPLTDDRLTSVAGVLIFTLGAIAIGSSVRSRRLHLRELVERADALARDRERQAELARVSERNRIAREMHDVVAHSLSVMVALADGAGAALDRAPDSSRAALAELATTGRTALADMRRVLGVLNEGDAPLEPQPGSPGLDALVERFRAAGVPVVADGLHTELPADAGFQLTVYRVVQEALTNTLRHAPGTPSAELTIHRDAAGVRIEVTDHGPRLPLVTSEGSHRGLVGMAERVQAYGGHVSSGPWQDGWRVRVTLPWEEPDS
jgi:signal transduction histidine kinase